MFSVRDSKTPLLLDPHRLWPESSTFFGERQHLYYVIFDLLPSLPSHDLIVYMLVLFSVWARSQETFLDLNLTGGHLKEEAGSADGSALNYVKSTNTEPSGPQIKLSGKRIEYYNSCKLFRK